jgi:hypothetical protein
VVDQFNGNDWGQGGAVEYSLRVPISVAIERTTDAGIIAPMTSLKSGRKPSPSAVTFKTKKGKEK